jgi:uncharacterized protein YgiM (DUF1202 family)
MSLRPWHKTSGPVTLGLTLFMLFTVLSGGLYGPLHAQGTSNRTATARAATATPVATGSAASEQPLPDAGTPTATTAPTEPAPTPTSTVGPPIVELRETEVLTGTIIANRTAAKLIFFLEGRLYELSPLRSAGVAPLRNLAALVLYNCGVADRAADPDCSWDPYLVRQDGFYEIVNNAERSAPVSLLLQDAGAPPTGQIWIQNRTGHGEHILHNDELYELDNAHTLELTLDEISDDSRANGANGQIGAIYLRRCLGIALRSVCEWLPAPVVSGVYYALLDDTVTGPYADSASTNIRLRPVLGEERLALLATPTPEPTPEPAPLAAPLPVRDTPPIQAVGPVSCQIQVPILNVRAGPGLEYPVLDQISQADASRGRVEVTGRDNANSWLSVQESVAAGGWIINQANFVRCEAATASLPVAQGTDRSVAAPAPTPLAAAPTPTQETPPVRTPDGVACQVQIAALNLRAGPGTDYLVIGQIRQADAHRGRIVVTGRNAASDWLAIQPSLAAGGWIANQQNLVTCESAVAPLPVAQVTDGRLAASEPAPAAVAAQPAAQPAISTTAPQDPAPPEPAPQDPVAQPPGIPAGRSRIIVTNAFAHEIRFTLDAREHGLPDSAPSEYDLAVGQSLQFDVYGGRVRFSVSSPFRNSSGNAEFFIDQGQSRALMVHFAPDGERWVLRY